MDDRLDRAGVLAIVLAALSLLMPASVLVGTLLLPQHPSSEAERIMEGLALPSPSLVPSGRTLRDPMLGHSGVDPRHDPLVPAADPDPARLLVPVRDGAAW